MDGAEDVGCVGQTNEPGFGGDGRVGEVEFGVDATRLIFRWEFGVPPADFEILTCC